MEEVEPWNEKQLAAMRSILLNWASLSRGDISIVTQCVRNPEAVALTVRGSAHAGLWQELVSIGWAEHLYSPIDPYDQDPEPLAFRLVRGGHRPFSHFLVYYDLLNMGACTPTSDAQALKAGFLDSSKVANDKASLPAIRQTPPMTNARFAAWVWAFVAVLFVGVAIGGAVSG